MKKISLSLAFEKILNSPNIANTKPIYEKYDKDVQGNTIHERGNTAISMTSCFRGFPELDEDCANISVAIATGGNPNLAKISAQKAAENAVAEAALKINCVGGTPLAATDCLNFGNPEKPDQMGNLVAGIEGVKIACETLQIPIVSGNVSRYNDYAGTPIPPSAVISIFGKVTDPSLVPPLDFSQPGETIFVLGKRSKNLGGSEFLRCFDQKDSQIPETNYADLEVLFEGFKTLIQAKAISSMNPILRGGLFVALCQSSFKNKIGLHLDIPADESVPHFLFSEDLGVIVSTKNPEKIREIMGASAIEIGTTTADFQLTIDQATVCHFDESLENYKKNWDTRLRSIF